MLGLVLHHRSAQAMELCQIEQNARQKACKEKTAETSLPVHKKDSNHSLVRPQVQYRNSDLF